MFQGDSLSILLFLAGSAIGCMTGAICAPEGWRTKVLWGLTIGFGTASAGWVLAPSASPVVSSIEPVLSAVIDSGIWIMVGTVAIVAIMNGGRGVSSKAAASAQADEDDKPQTVTPRDKQNTFIHLSAAASTAKRALAARNMREAEKVLPAVKAAVLSAHKAFGTPTLSDLSDARETVAFGALMIEKMMPYLSQGHVEEARNEAQALVDALAHEGN